MFYSRSASGQAGQAGLRRLEVRRRIQNPEFRIQKETGVAAIE